MLRCLVVMVLVTPFVAAADSPVSQQLSLQTAILEAERFLDANKPAEAIAVLEPLLDSANGNATYLGQLRQAYTSELKRLRLAKTPNTTRINELQDRLKRLKADPARVETVAAPVAPPTISVASDATPNAIELFRRARTEPKLYADAAAAFAKTAADGRPLPADHAAAWVYSRLWVVADVFNKSPRNAAAAATARQEITAALQLVPQHAELQAAGKKLLADVVVDPTSGPTSAATTPRTAASDGWFSLESENFRFRFQGPSASVAPLLARAEDHRRAIFALWSGGPPTAWQPKCEVVLHATPDAFTAATNQPAEARGHAFVKLEGRRPTDRRIDLQSNDDALSDATLPRELTHIVLADLFPDRTVPLWASIGMAVLSAGGDEAERCARTVSRCQQAGELVPASKFFDAAAPTPEAVTGYYVQSVSVVDHLVKKKDAKTFRIFLLDAQRYGVAGALQRQYGYASMRAFEDDWRRSTTPDR